MALDSVDVTDLLRRKIRSETYDVIYDVTRLALGLSVPFVLLLIFTSFEADGWIPVLVLGCLGVSSLIRLGTPRPSADEESLLAGLLESTARELRPGDRPDEP